MGGKMKKLKIYYLLTSLSIILFTGCSLNYTEVKSSSSLVRTVGIGENAMPIEKGSFALEFFNEEATTVDVITETYTHTGDIFEEDEQNIYGGVASDALRYYGFNARIGFDNYTEAKIGVFAGSIEGGHKRVVDYDNQGNDFSSYAEYNTNINGFHVGLKRLLTGYDEPHRISLYLEGRYLKTYSDGFSDKYDGTIMEAKLALIYGYLPNPDKRSFPSIAFYSNVANTEREETIEGIPLKKQPQAIGAEVNYSIDMYGVYTIISLGAEKEIVEKATDDINIYFGMKVGLHFNQLKKQ
jgi:hypothetical protein